MQPISNYVFLPMPKIVFGKGVRSELKVIAQEYGNKILLVTGSHSFKQSKFYMELLDELHAVGCQTVSVEVHQEPSVVLIDNLVKDITRSDFFPDVVVAVGGGSVIDAGKAISAMLKETGSIRDYLEGMEKRKLRGVKVPFIALPTTSGTGSEATKNAVISEISENGFKRSLRHDRYVPEVALLDPELMLTLPKDRTAACGLDALTQLLEGFVSAKASPLTDALAWSGLESFKRSFVRTLERGLYDVEARADMAYAALLSGVVLANAGLGVVHGFASPLGAYYTVPHGVVCAALLPDCTKANVQHLIEHQKQSGKESGPVQSVALFKYAQVGRLFSDAQDLTTNEACRALCDYLEQLVETAQIRKLSHYGLKASDFEKIIAGTNVKNGPVNLERDVLTRILENQLL